MNRYSIALNITPEEEELQKAYSLCTVKEISSGHQACFLGQYFTATETDGPNEHTKLLAKRGAIFCKCLTEREKNENKKEE